MIVHYTDVKDLTEQREKLWCIFPVQGAEKSNIKGVLLFFILRKV